MSKRKRRRYQPPPTPPPDLWNYILVNSKEGPYYRRKRGTVTEATLNTTLTKYAATTGIASPAARRIKIKLGESLRGLDTARFIANFSARLKKNYIETGTWNYSLLDKYDLQPDNPMGELLKCSYIATRVKNEFAISIKLNEYSVDKKNSLVSGYYFDLVLLWGDPSKKNALRIDTDTSPLYPINMKSEKECKLCVQLPLKKTPWMALLKISCLEEKKPAHHPRHYGMKVVGTSI